MVKQLLDLASQGKTKKFWVEDGLLYTTSRRIFAAMWGNLRHTLIEEGNVTILGRTPRPKALLGVVGVIILLVAYER